MLEVANITFRVAGPGASTAGPVGGHTIYNESQTLMPSAELTWEEVRGQKAETEDLHSKLFGVLAEAGDLLTIPRNPEELFEPILDLVETALEPERTFVLLIEEEGEEPVNKAARVKGRKQGESLALSRTMMKQVLQE